ncbi:hypothetical protein MBLNU230_g1259t1 [Neophaeotheca triangularis]
MAGDKAGWSQKHGIYNVQGSSGAAAVWIPTRTWDGLVVSLSASDKQAMQKFFADIFMNDLILFFEGRDQISANSTPIAAPPNPEQTVQEVQSRRQHYAQDDATLFARGHMANMTWAELWGFAVYRIVRAIEKSKQVTFPTWQGRSTPAATSASKAIDSDEKKLRYAYALIRLLQSERSSGRYFTGGKNKQSPRPEIDARTEEFRAAYPSFNVSRKGKKQRKKQKKGRGDAASKDPGAGSDEEHNQQEQDKALGLTAKGGDKGQDKASGLAAKGGDKERLQTEDEDELAPIVVVVRRQRADEDNVAAEGPAAVANVQEYERPLAQLPSLTDVTLWLREVYGSAVIMPQDYALVQFGFEGPENINPPTDPLWKDFSQNWYTEERRLHVLLLHDSYFPELRNIPDADDEREDPSLKASGRALPFVNRSSAETLHLLQTAMSLVSEDNARDSEGAAEIREDFHKLANAADGRQRLFDAGEAGDVDPRDLMLRDVQNMLSNVNIGPQNAKQSVEWLSEYLGLDPADQTSPVHCLALRPDKNHPKGPGIPGKALKPHQKIFNYWAVQMERHYGGGWCGDDCGLGKTYQILAFINLATLFWMLQGRTEEALTPSRPTLIVVPSGLEQKWQRMAREALPARWRVWRHGSDGKHGQVAHDNGPEDGSVRFTKLDSHVQAFRSAYNVIIMTINELQILKISQIEEHSDVAGLFERIVVDESQSLRNYEKTARGTYLSKFQARFRWCMTATPCYNSLQDVRGHLAFFERPEWLDTQDLDLEQATSQGNELYRATVYGKLPDDVLKVYAVTQDEKRALQEVFANPDDDEVFTRFINLVGPHLKDRVPRHYRECTCDADDAGDDVEEEVRLLCQHFPSCKRRNLKRRPSMAHEERFDTNMRRFRNYTDEEKKADGATSPPFKANPYNLYNALSKDQVKCLTRAAFNYWISPHIAFNADNDDHHGDTEKAAQRVKMIFQTLMLSRSHGTLVEDEDGSFVTCGGDMPTFHIRTQDLVYTKQEQDAYDLREGKIAKVVEWKKLLATLKTELDAEELLQSDVTMAARSDKPKKRLASAAQAAVSRRFPQLSVLPTHLGLAAYYTRNTTWFRKIRDMLLDQLVDEMRKKNALDPSDTDPLETPAQYLRAFLWGAPKLAYLCLVIWKVQFSADKKPAGKQKILIMCSSSRSAEFVHTLIGWLGITSIILDVLIIPKDRDPIINQFNKDDEPMIMITTYNLNIAGHDLHHKCCTVVILEPAFNEASEVQASHRVYRIGQTEPVEVIRLFTENTYNEMQEWRMAMKVSPYLQVTQATVDEIEKSDDAVSGAELAQMAFGQVRKRYRYARLDKDKKKQADDAKSDKANTKAILNEGDEAGVRALTVTEETVMKETVMKETVMEAIELWDTTTEETVTDGSDA